MQSDGRNRAVIESVKPELDSGRWPIKRVLGERVTVTADIFSDGHDLLSAVLRHRHKGSPHWTEIAMEPLGNDRWRGQFGVHALGRYEYTICAWVDHFKTWHRDLKRRIEAGQPLEVEMEIGARLIERCAERAEGHPADQMLAWSQALRSEMPVGEKVDLVMDSYLLMMLARHPDRSLGSTYDRTLEVVVDPPRARFSAWYELFPRSAAPEPGRHGTFRDVEARLPAIARMGFDVLYLPPIHPIGRKERKGPNNTLTPGPDDPGSPWAIGGPEGGHKAIHPELGTAEDFQRLVENAREQGIEVALDIAFQCSPDHPYVREHPEWFQHRPDGSVQYAENPPKKYQDIYPFDFQCAAWRELWEELYSIFEHWAGQGVRIFRVDNPHTKPFALWDWIIGRLKQRWPETIFLSEAFTRPRVMYRLAKGGFTQSYTYFAWRNSSHGLREYLTELTRTEVCEFLRPNFWPNTPDILNEYLQHGGRPAFITRLVLAATLGASYGIYGPAYELIENTPREPGSEEYLGSEKFEIRHWDLNRPDSLAPLISQLNRIRRENPALHANERLVFHNSSNDQILCYSKSSEDGANIILVAVNLDPWNTQGSWLGLDGAALGLDDHSRYQVHDQLSQERYNWTGLINYVQLNPYTLPAHVFRLRRHLRSEHDFEYFL